jgi:hypothetical protein
MRNAAARVATLILCLNASVFAFAQFATVLNVPPDAAPQSIGSNTQLNLFDGGVLPAGFEAGLANDSSTNVEVNIAGGNVGDTFRANGGSTVNMSGGRVGFDAIVKGGGIVNITGGVVTGFAAFNGSVVNISGGFIGPSFRAREGSTLNVLGGQVSVRAIALPTSKVNLSGGAIGPNFQAQAGSSVKIFGGDFRSNGVPINGLDSIGSTLPFQLSGSGILSGTFADGTPFAFGRRSFDEPSDSFAPGSLTLERVSLPLGPQTIIASRDPVPGGVHYGQTLIVDAGGIVPESFRAGWGSTVEVQPGGTVGNLFEATGATVNFFGGSAFQIDALVGTTINIAGGSVSEVHARSATVNLFGRQFLHNGNPINGLIPGQQFTLNWDYGFLSGILADGTPFNYRPLGRDHPLKIGEGAVLTLTLVPEPATFVLFGIGFATIAMRSSRAGRS